MSDVSQGPGWWLASDGKWYPPDAVSADAVGRGGVGARSGSGPAAGPVSAVIPPVDDAAAADADAGVRHQVIGTVMPVLEISLDPGQRVIAESGELSWMTASIELQTSTSGAGSSGVMGALKRSLGGGSLFMTEYTAVGAPGTVAFATKMPGHIRPVEVGPGRQYMVHRHGFLAGTAGVELAIGFQQSFGAGLFGGNGFVLQRVGGTGTAWIELSGELVEYQLGPGETMRVHPGHVGLLDSTVSFEITRMRGIKNIVFGSDGLFLAALTGPGRVWLQTLPLPNLAHALDPYLAGRESSGSTSGAGGLLGNILGPNS